MLLAWPATAQTRRGEAVLVLEASSGGWKAGVQALVAELLSVGYELRVQAAASGPGEELERELLAQMTASGASAGVAVTREGAQATALLCQRGERECQTLSVEVSDAELSRSRLALAVVERLRPVELPLTEPSQPVTPPRTAAPPPPPAKALPTAAPPSERPTRPVRLWLGGGAVLASGTSAPTPWLSAALTALLAEPWGVELGVAGSPLPGQAETPAGSLSLRAFEALGFATFEPFAQQRFGFGLGLGGGAVRLQETASPAPGFTGFSRGVTIGVVSARARLRLKLGRLHAALSADPGLLVPAVKVEAGTETILRIGRPWLVLQASVGVEL